MDVLVLIDKLDDLIHNAKRTMLPGSDQVRGFMPNTRLFEVMMNAWGWKPDTKQ